MISFRVKDLRAMLAQLREAGVAIEDKVDESDFGAFGCFTVSQHLEWLYDSQILESLQYSGTLACDG